MLPIRIKVSKDELKRERLGSCAIIRGIDPSYDQRSLATESVTQTADLTQVQHALFTVLVEQANALARSTGLIVRQRKLTGASLASLLILGWLHDPQASLDALAQFAGSS